VRDGRERYLREDVLFRIFELLSLFMQRAWFLTLHAFCRCAFKMTSFVAAISIGRPTNVFRQAQSDYGLAPVKCYQVFDGWTCHIFLQLTNVDCRCRECHGAGDRQGGCKAMPHEISVSTSSDPVQSICQTILWHSGRRRHFRTVAIVRGLL
jgi:hypothetical protein